MSIEQYNGIQKQYETPYETPYEYRNKYNKINEMENNHIQAELNRHQM